MTKTPTNPLPSYIEYPSHLYDYDGNHSCIRCGREHRPLSGMILRKCRVPADMEYIVRQLIIDEEIKDLGGYY